MENETIVEHTEILSEQGTPDGVPVLEESRTPQDEQDVVLLERYKQLQAAFTRQAQELAEFKRETANACAAPKIEPEPPVSKEQIIQEYLSDLKTKQSPPATLGTGATFMRSATESPRSMRESAQLVKEYFSRR